MADFVIEPSSYFSEANKPKTIVVKPSKANTGSIDIVKRLKISAPGYPDKYVTLTHKGTIP